MALDNLRCPQFVDFTNTATFDIDDGADVYFERGLVGEFGLGFDDINQKDDGIDELIAALNEATNLQAASCQTTSKDKKDSGISEAFSVSPNQLSGNKSGANEHRSMAKNTKTNSVTKKSTPIRKRTNSVSSNKSTDSKVSKIQQQQQGKNIVKKTLAKVTAAFKTTKLVENDQLKLKSKCTNSQTNKKKQEGPLKVFDSKLNQEIVNETTTSSSNGNRRCSSVPRTLKEKQALNKQQITFGEKIQNFFTRDSNKNQERGRLRNDLTSGVKHQKSKLLLDDKSTTMINKAATQLKRQPTINEPKSPNFSFKPRQNSADRKDIPMLPYQGVKFIPKVTHKYNPSEPFSNSEERSKQQLMVKKEITKPMVVLSSKPNGGGGVSFINNTLHQSSRLNNSVNKNGNKENTNNNNNSTAVDSVLTANTKPHSYGNDSILSNKIGNISTLSNNSRKLRVDPKPFNLQTEARAQKRHQYDQYLKDKEKMTEMIRKNLEMQKMIEVKNDIQKMRSQLLFKSKPFKQIKAMEIKPSDKPLTEPKSPHLGLYLSTAAGTSNSKLVSSKSVTNSSSHDNISVN